VFTWLFFAAVAFAFLDWASTWKGWKVRLYIAKPATLIFLVLWTLQISSWQGLMVWFGLGLCFSLLGDIALLLSPRFFMVGLGSFLLAHIAYLVGFNQQPAPLSLGVTLVAVMVGLVASVVLRQIRPGITRAPHGKRFLTAVLFYGATLTFMLLAALITLFRPDWQPLHAMMAAIGALLFFTSDSLLGYDRFVRKLKHGQSYVHLTYHLGQACLIIGAMGHYLSLT
jgi:uncharacterized membrane protein YhhN